MASRFLSDFNTPPFTGLNTFFGLNLCDLQAKCDFGILGIPFDLGATYKVGQRFAPQKIRESSRILSGVDYFLREEVFKKKIVCDLGDIKIEPGMPEESLKVIEKNIMNVSKETNLISVGGDHTVTLSILRAFKRKFGKINLIDFDAHTDSWDELYHSKISHANWFRRALEEDLINDAVQIGIRGSLYSKEDDEFQDRYGVKVINMEEIREKGFDSVISAIAEYEGLNNIYITVDIDVVDPAFAPGTGIPEPGGLSSWEIMSFFRKMHLRPIGMDIVEVIPDADHSGITSILSSNLIFLYISMLSKLG